MTLAYFDTISGISGDMTLGAFINAGVPFNYLLDELGKLHLSGYTIRHRTIKRNAITSTKVDIEIETADHHTHGRHLSSILSLIDASTLSERVRQRSAAIFRIIGEAESKIHGTTIDRIHFHEVGAVDSILDIVGTCICLEYFNIEQVYSSAVKLGSGGLVQTQHGALPIPAPATVEILQGYPVVLTDIPHELTTPTGAGIIKSLSRGTLSFEQLKVTHIGYGTGTKEIESLPNLLRIFIGEMAAHYDHDELVTVETNIDNMNPEIFPYVIERLLSKGAHDAYLIPIVMKKGRPGIILSTLVNRGNLSAILDTIFAETTTLGVRIQPVERRKLQRGTRTVQTIFGPMSIKTVMIEGREKLVPEFEECKRIAAEKNLPLLDVYKQIERELA